MKSRKAVSSRKQEDSNDNLKSYFLKIRILCEIHRRVCRYTEKFSPILLFIFYYKYHPNREVAAFREPLLVFSENLPGKESGYAKYITGKKKSAKPFEGSWSFIVRTEFLFISMEHQALRKKSQKPVRLRKTGSICGIIRKMKTAISPV
mgnify:CR=1 FL=1